MGHIKRFAQLSWSRLPFNQIGIATAVIYGFTWWIMTLRTGLKADNERYYDPDTFTVLFVASPVIFLAVGTFGALVFYTAKGIRKAWRDSKEVDDGALDALSQEIE